MLIDYLLEMCREILQKDDRIFQSIKQQYPDICLDDFVNNNEMAEEDKRTILMAIIDRSINISIL